MKSLGFIIRNSRSFRNESALKTLYDSFLRSQLEYSSIIWNPIYQVHKNALE
nr:unnamed protein product [Callosobruchus chinensis]